jgi:tryptophan synthase beta subunit
MLYSGEPIQTPMNTDERRERREELTETIVGCASRASNALGVGFLDQVDESALAVALRRAGTRAQQQHHVEVTYEGTVLGGLQSAFIGVHLRLGALLPHMSSHP